MALEEVLRNYYSRWEKSVDKVVYPDEVTSSVIKYMRPHHPEIVDDSPGKMGIKEWKVWDIPSINARLDLSIIVSEEHNNAYNVIGAWFYHMKSTSEEDLKPFRDALENNGFKDLGLM